MSKQTEYAWAAGFFDGEGCASIQHQKGYYCARLHVVQKDIRPLEHFKAIFELSETLHSVQRQQRKHLYYRLTISGARAAEILTLMLPYLTLKREVAEAVIELQNEIASYSVTQRSAGLPKSTYEKRNVLYQRAKWLNSGRWAAAETKPSGTMETSLCDSPNCIDSKDAESAEMPDRVH